MHFLDQPHHDGSPLYLDASGVVVGGSFTVHVRVPTTCAVRSIRVRTTPNREPLYRAEAKVSRVDGDATWWTAEVPAENPVVRYRFLVEGEDQDYWLNSAGFWPNEVSDNADFVVTTFDPPPAWLASTIGYQIFPDRFARSGQARDTPQWAIAADWRDEILADPADGVRQWFGGDLAGIEAHLDYVQSLGANLLYLTPIFPAGSSHRYDATTFAAVDPLLGGNTAYASLIKSAHDRGIRVIGDITLNHTGNHHEWFRAAQADADSAEASFYFFDEHPNRYRAWADVPSLPKLDYRSPALWERLITADDSVIRTWLRPPYALDGWRVDCANVTGRIDDMDFNHAVATTTRAVIEQENPDAWLLAEHCHDAQIDMLGDGWHGTMAYHSFSRPLAWWLVGDGTTAAMFDERVRPHSGQRMVHAMRTLAAGIPWPVRNASMMMLDSHDTARLRSVVGGDAARHLVAMAMLFTFPGVPTVFAGSEVGAMGDNMDAARVPFDWTKATWDRPFLDAVRSLSRLRSSSAALRFGSLRWVHASDDVVVYLREVAGERVLVALSRAPHAAVVLDAATLYASSATTLFGSDLRFEGAGVLFSDVGPSAGIWRLDG